MYDIFSVYSNAAGLLGVTLVLIAYYLLNIKVFLADDIRYVMLNLAGSVLLLYSLFFHWNLSSVLIEIAWIMISLIGAYQYYRKKKLKINIPDNVIAIDKLKKKNKIK